MRAKAMHDISQNQDACDILAEKLELEGEEGLGDFVKCAIDETLAELKARRHDELAAQARSTLK